MTKIKTIRFFLGKIQLAVNGNCTKNPENERKGIIRTPNYPLQNYENKMDCTWTLTASNGKRIVIDPFQISIEGCNPKDNKKPKCTCDYLYIQTSQSEAGKRYCGEKAVPGIESKENVLLLRFHSDEGMQRFRGFKLKYHVK